MDKIIRLAHPKIFGFMKTVSLSHHQYTGGRLESSNNNFNSKKPVRKFRKIVTLVGTIGRMQTKFILWFRSRIITFDSELLINRPLGIVELYVPDCFDRIVCSVVIISMLNQGLHPLVAKFILKWLDKKPSCHETDLYHSIIKTTHPHKATGKESPV